MLWHAAVSFSLDRGKSPSMTTLNSDRLPNPCEIDPATKEGGASNDVRSGSMNFLLWLQ
jgi:hypothetical protein